MPETSPQPVSAAQEQSLQSTGDSCSKLCLGIPLGTWWGIHVRVSVLYFVVWGASGWFANYYTSWEWAVLWGTLFGPVIKMTILIHEFGHGITTNKLGGRATEILLWPLGGVCLLDHNGGPRTDFWITVAGPLTHIPQGLFFLVQAPLARMIADCEESTISPRYCAAPFWGVFWYRIVFAGVVFNVLFLVVNLFIPMYPLDGGRALLDAFLAFGMTPRKAAISCVTLSIPMAVVGAVLAAVYLDDLVTFSLALLMLIPNMLMIYLIVKNQLHLHPSFRNLRISSDEMDTPFINNQTNGQPDTEMAPTAL